MALAKKINELTPLTDTEAADPTRLLVMADPTTGVAYSATRAQVGAAVITTLKYVATGAEGTTITISALAGKTIYLITREGSVLYDVTLSPDSTEYIWDLTDITLGLATGAGERFKILYGA